MEEEPVLPKIRGNGPIRLDIDVVRITSAGMTFGSKAQSQVGVVRDIVEYLTEERRPWLVELCQFAGDARDSEHQNGSTHRHQSR